MGDSGGYESRGCRNENSRSAGGAEIYDEAERVVACYLNWLSSGTE